MLALGIELGTKQVQILKPANLPYLRVHSMHYRATSSTLPTAMQLVSTMVAFLLWMMPLMINSRNQDAVMDEFVTRSLPISVEEEVKSTCAEMHWENAFDEPVLTHGDVAVPPPKA